MLHAMVSSQYEVSSFSLALLWSNFVVLQHPDVPLPCEVVQGSVHIAHWSRCAQSCHFLLWPIVCDKEQVSGDFTTFWDVLTCSSGVRIWLIFLTNCVSLPVLKSAWKQWRNWMIWLWKKILLNSFIRRLVSCHEYIYFSHPWKSGIKFTLCPQSCVMSATPERRFRARVPTPSKPVISDRFIPSRFQPGKPIKTDAFLFYVGCLIRPKWGLCRRLLPQQRTEPCHFSNMLSQTPFYHKKAIRILLRFGEFCRCLLHQALHHIVVLGNWFAQRFRQKKETFQEWFALNWWRNLSFSRGKYSNCQLSSPHWIFI